MPPQVLLLAPSNASFFCMINSVDKNPIYIIPCDHQHNTLCKLAHSGSQGGPLNCRQLRDLCRQVSPHGLRIILNCLFYSSFLFAIIAPSLFSVELKRSITGFGRTLLWIHSLISMLSLLRFYRAYSLIFVHMSVFWWENGRWFFVTCCRMTNLRYHLETVLMASGRCQSFINRPRLLTSMSINGNFFVVSDLYFV